MENKINIAELLKDYPKGMELDCVLFDKPVKYNGIDDGGIFPINILTENDVDLYLTKEGHLFKNIPNSKCVIFPKGKTTWEGFVPHCEFKEGDVICTDNFVAILSNITERGSVWYHCYYCIDTEMFKAKRDFGIGNINCDEFRFATEEEKQKLFDAIKANGYNWNAVTKTLEKLVEPRFKVGNTIQDENEYKVKITEVNIEDECYGYESIIAKGIGGIAFSEQDNWELIPDKFDITTLVPFESRVLVRDTNMGKWKPNFWGFYDIDYAMTYPYECCGGSFAQCIPYEGNEHLLGKYDDCDEFYKTW